MKLSIQKYDPAIDAEPYTIDCEIEYTEKMSLLEAVGKAHEENEFIVFDYSCHGHHCGRCAVMLDGVPSLMCATPLTDKNHKVEPLAGHNIVRDLIVDKTDYRDRLAKVYDRVRIEPVSDDGVAVFDGTKTPLIKQLEMCARCGMCDSVCPVHTENPSAYVGPSTMVAIAYRHYDSYDQADRLLEAVSKGMYHCILCSKCNEVCQRYEIEHVNTWKKLREEAEAAGLKPSYT